jgi:anti-sigma regulatory factor (Ser/Thr protein kinase)
MERLIVPGTLESLEAISEFVTELAAMAGLDENSSYRLLLAVDEIATNIVAHSYDKMGIKGVMELRADVDEKELTICIEDTGLTYNPQKYQRPDDLDQPLEKRKIGGLGVFLAMHSVDRFHYERVGDRNRHTLIVSR